MSDSKEMDKYGSNAFDALGWAERGEYYQCLKCRRATKGKDYVNFAAHGIHFRPFCKEHSPHVKKLAELGITQEQFDEQKDQEDFPLTNN